MEYLLILFIVIVCSFMDIYVEDKKTRNLIYALLCFILIIFAGTRFETGSDWPDYTSTFNNDVGTLKQLLNGTVSLSESRMESGYIVVNSIVKSLGGSINEVFLIMAAITIPIIFKSCKRYTPYCFVAILLYLRYAYPQTNFMFVRQGLSIAVFLYSIRYIHEKNFLKYFICITICVLFHKSTLVLYPVYFIVNREYKTSILVILMGLSVILGFTRWINFITLFTPDVIDKSINSYLSAGMSAGISPAMIEKILVILVALIFRKKLSEKFKYFNIFLNLYVISFMSYYSLIESYVLQQRMVIIFNISGIILISYFIYLGNKKIIKSLICAVIAVMVSVFFIKSVSLFNEDSDYVPYKSYIPMYIESIKDKLNNQ
ncbi:MAG: EpsG family protein [Paraclostridium bifermentans]|uniref:EpsG family protein n=1 Tax=Paraclostridium bifermentans TaxID=1490 RepID=UPI0011DD6720|nr:EpsG family protein [Paraclostridium bifermentans]MBS6507610.1 EpsG family protein [Paraclostridium bifermentans]MDU3802655.1 EpsG family protein [Paraclostridium bifermentans]